TEEDVAFKTAVKAASSLRLRIQRRGRRHSRAILEEEIMLATNSPQSVPGTNLSLQNLLKEDTAGIMYEMNSHVFVRVLLQQFDFSPTRQDLLMWNITSGSKQDMPLIQERAAELRLLIKDHLCDIRPLQGSGCIPRCHCRPVLSVNKT
ncbi:hypothetical protein CRENBAI_007192, partial [Crenichthys baileyi]